MRYNDPEVQALVDALQEKGYRLIGTGLDGVSARLAGKINGEMAFISIDRSKLGSKQIEVELRGGALPELVHSLPRSEDVEREAEDLRQRWEKMRERLEATLRRIERGAPST